MEHRYLVRHLVLALVTMLLGAASALAQRAPVVLAPNGGERYEMTDPVVVRWSAPDARAVRVEYSPNGGRIWIVIDTAVNASLGTLTFMPGYPTLFGRVRVTDVDRPTLFDDSDGNFIVLEAPSIAIYSPSEGDRVVRGSTHVITWLAGRIARVNIEYSPNGGSPGSWQRLATGIDARRGFFEWSVPSTLTTMGKIRILDADGPTIGETGLFQIVDPVSTQPFVRLLVPNGGEVYTVGDDITIAWASSGPTSNISIDLSSDAGATWRNIITRPTGPAITSIVWPSGTAPAPTPGRDYRIRVTTELGADASDASFELRRRIVPKITVLSPNGGESYATDTTIDVRWSAVDLSGNLDIAYSLDAGATWRPIGTADAAVGSIRWPIPDTLTTKALVRVVAGPIGDTSDAVFSIIEPLEDSWIEVLSPNVSTDEWAEGSLAIVRWRSSGVTSVDITLSTDGGASWGRTIAQGVTATTGQYEYRVPHLADTVLTSLLVRVAASGRSAPFDYSNMTFRYRPTIAGIRGELIGTPLGLAPNPATTGARVTWRNAAGELRIFDASGRAVRSLELSREDRAADLEVGALARGVYVVEVRGVVGVERARLIVR
jgi:hypothetical protein